MHVYFPGYIGVSLLITMLCACQAMAESEEASPQTVTLITDNNYEPYSYVQDNELRGQTVEWIRRIDEALPEYRISLQAMPWREGLHAVRDGKVLGMVGVYFSAKHRGWLYPYSQPLFEESVVVLCGPDVQLESPVSWPTSFAGHLMLNIAGYDGWLDFQIRNQQNTQLMNFFEVPNQTIGYSMLKKGNADCMLSEKHFAEQALQHDTTEPDAMPRIVTEVRRKAIHVGYSFNAITGNQYPYALDFARAFDFAMSELKQKGELRDRLGTE